MNKRKTPFYIIAFIVIAALFITLKNLGESWQTQRDLAKAQASAQAVAAQEETPQVTPENSNRVEYRKFPFVGSRVAIWVVAELHLMFAAFVLAVPMFALIIEFIGYYTKDKRYDQLAYEFTKLLSYADHLLSQINHLPDCYFYPHLSPLRSAVFCRSRFSLRLLLRLGQVFSESSPGAGGDAEPCGHDHYVHRQRLAYLYEFSRRD